MMGRILVKLFFLGIFFLWALIILNGCASRRVHAETTEYFPTGELKTRTIRNPFEYEIWEYYQNGVRKKVIYCTENHRQVKEYFEDGSLKREERQSPNDEFQEMRFEE